jgi:hypothetical protein
MSRPAPLTRFLTSHLTSNYTSKIFLPASFLTQYLTPSTISAHLSFRFPSLYTIVPSVPLTISTTCPRLFALLVYCQSENLILPLLDAGVSDENLPFDKPPACMGEKLGGRVLKEQWKFLAPVLGESMTTRLCSRF